MQIAGTRQVTKFILQSKTPENVRCETAISTARTTMAAAHRNNVLDSRDDLYGDVGDGDDGGGVCVYVCVCNQSYLRDVTVAVMPWTMARRRYLQTDRVIASDLRTPADRQSVWVSVQKLLWRAGMRGRKGRSGREKVRNSRKDNLLSMHG